MQDYSLVIGSEISVLLLCYVLAECTFIVLSRELYDREDTTEMGMLQSNAHSLNNSSIVCSIQNFLVILRT